MSQRSERREAERQTRKLAYQELRQAQKSAAAAEPVELPAPDFEDTPEVQPEPAISEIQLAANRANAQLSSGPSTPAGKAISSMNALKTGLTGRTVLLRTDDPAEYDRRLEFAFLQHRPATEEEQAIVKSIVDIEWRLNRILVLETGIYNKGITELDGQYKDESPARRKSLVETEAYLKYEKSLRNLHTQESRLNRQHTKALAELKRLTDERTRQAKLHPRTAQPARTASNGFEFSTPKSTPSQPAQNVTNAPITAQNHAVARH